MRKNIMKNREKGGKKAQKTKALERCLETDIPQEVYDRMLREMEGQTHE